MMLKERIQKLRKEKNMSQEGLADILGISRQAVTKWENGESLPDIDNLIKISNIFSTSLDKLLKDESCVSNYEKSSIDEDIISFLCEAKKNTYAGSMSKLSNSSRPNSVDLIYNKGPYKYYDSYFGGERFIGEEVLFKNDIPIWAMNYSGIEINDRFSTNFLKEALSKVELSKPFRGPSVYKNGDYIYVCQVDGDFSYFKGKEEIYLETEKVYQCYFHGGIIK